MNVPNSRPDVEVIIRNKRPSKRNIYSGYRPAFKVRDDYLTTGIIKLIDADELPYDNEAKAVI